MRTQQQHFMVGATLGTEDRGDICIRDGAGNLLYRMVPTVQRPEESLAEILRVCSFQSRALAKRDNVPEPVTPARLAQGLLTQFDEAVRELARKVQELPAEHAQVLQATLDRAMAASNSVGPVLAMLELPSD